METKRLSSASPFPRIERILEQTTDERLSPQVYQADTDQYIVKDKYYGRGLDEDGFRAALWQFFHNGFQVRLAAIHNLIQRLQLLSHAIQRQNSFRFYSR